MSELSLDDLKKLRKLMEANKNISHMETNKCEFCEDTSATFMVNDDKLTPYSSVGKELHVPIDAPKNEVIGPPMYLIGHCYKQENGQTVLIVGASNQNTSYETVYSVDTEGNTIHRYNRRDHGRVTGSNNDPRNLIDLKTL